MNVLERLAARVLALPVVECAVCARRFVRSSTEKACSECRQRPDWRSGTFRAKQLRQPAVEARRREREARREERHAPILELRAQGLGYKAIARELGVSRDQVRHVVLYHERAGA